MTAYHVNPDTAVRSVCSAKYNCRFGKKYDSIAEADAESANILHAAEKYADTPTLRHEIALTPDVEEVLDKLYSIGNPMIVGGAVRDSFIGKENKDVDIEVHGASTDEIVDTLKKDGYAIDEVGKQFGVLKVSKKGKDLDLDVSVPRTENKTGSKHGDFTVDVDENLGVEEAAARRDFTFNAIMYDHSLSRIIDPYHGSADLNKGTLRHVGDKFSEDPLRVLRGVQFAGRFDLEAHPSTVELSKELKDEFTNISSERVQEEFTKFYTKSTHHSQGLRFLKQSQWSDNFPGLNKVLSDESVYDSMDNVSNAPQGDRVVIGASILSAEMPDQDRQAFYSSTITGNDNRRAVKALLKSSGRDLSTSFGRKNTAKELTGAGFSFRRLHHYAESIGNRRLSEACQQAKREGIYEGPEKDLINGDDVMETFGKSPGKWIGQVIPQLRKAQYQGVFNSREEGLKYLEENRDILDFD